MSIEQTNVVDFLALDRQTGEVALVVSDHLPWDEQGLHLKLLQDKLNAYLAFIESGEIYEQALQSFGHAIAVGQPIVIRIVAKFPPSEQGELFLSKATPAIRDAGFDLQFTVWDPTEG